MVKFEDSVRAFFTPRSAAGPRRPTSDATDQLRERTRAYVNTLAESDRMPWDTLQQSIAAIMIEQLSRALPDAERDGVRAAFAAEMFRLRTAAAAD